MACFISALISPSFNWEEALFPSRYTGWKRGDEGPSYNSRAFPLSTFECLEVLSGTFAPVCAWSDATAKTGMEVDDKMVVVEIVFRKFLREFG
jgi:hypothetical protein